MTYLEDFQHSLLTLDIWLIIRQQEEPRMWDSLGWNRKWYFLSNRHWPTYHGWAAGRWGHERGQAVWGWKVLSGSGRWPSSARGWLRSTCGERSYREKMTWLSFQALHFGFCFTALIFLRHKIQNGEGLRLVSYPHSSLIPRPVQKMSLRTTLVQ